jgi:dihydropteroate synthase
MIEDGADILDIGAVSSRPNSKPISEDEEFFRIKEIIEIFYQNKIYEKIKLSLDSYSPKVIDFALNHGFKIINDITGLRHDEVARIVGKYDAEIVIMHMQGTPETMQNNPEYQDVIKEIYYYFSSMIEKAKKFGIDENKIILDPGIGFGKTLKHNIEILQSLRTFEILGFPILIGASRKSLINQIYPTPVEERLAGTLVLHQKALDNGAKILRVHDVKEHKQMIKTWKRFHQIETDLVNHND